MPSDRDDAVSTARLHLRRPTDADVDDLVVLHGDPAVMRFIDDGRPVPPDVVRTRDLGWLRGSYAPGRGYWVARVRAGGAFVGWFGLRPEPHDGSVLELGYRLTPAAWGRGYATEGARALVEEAFTVGEAQKVRATTMVANAASRHVLDQAGLHHLRTFFAEWPDPIPGSELGDVEYGLDVAEWRLVRAGG